MIDVDSSSLIAYFAGEKGKDIELVENSLADGLLVLPPPVLSELLSDPKIPKKLETALLQIPLLEQKENLWVRVGELRRNVVKKGLKARLANSLIVQFCLDHHYPIITRENDFKNFTKVSQLILF